MEGLGKIGYADFSNKLGSILKLADTYTATEDCWCFGQFSGTANVSGSNIFIDNVMVYHTNSNTWVMASFPLKVGQVVSMQGRGTVVELNFYKMLY